jgi:chromate reductase, NAD(P)H dehydrogenase (quinone)
MKILGISGSLRTGSYNKAIILKASELLPENVEMSFHDLHQLPLYDDILAAENPPQSVLAFRQAIAQADGLLIASPEYNYTMTGVLKNALDWAATNTISNILSNKTVAIMGASRTVFGTVRAQNHLRQVLHAVNANVIRKPEVYIRRAQDLIMNDGDINDEKTVSKIKELVDALIEELSRK